MPIPATRTIVPPKVRNFGRHGDDSAELPPLTDIQVRSYERFLQLDVPPAPGVLSTEMVETEPAAIHMSDETLVAPMSFEEFFEVEQERLLRLMWLVTGDHPSVRPGATFSAGVTIAVTARAARP